MVAATYVWGTGRRKKAVARVRVRPGTGLIQINGKEMESYFPTADQRRLVVGPLDAAGVKGKLDVFARVHGGGPVGQAGAVRLGIARAVKSEGTEPALRQGGFLTRDARMKERKKYGQRGARRRFQFSKR
ncbi:MAG: 30S ribosomal protein S9 [Planctomycetaceae bacterium]